MLVRTLLVIFLLISIPAIAQLDGGPTIGSSAPYALRGSPLPNPTTEQEAQLLNSVYKNDLGYHRAEALYDIILGVQQEATNLGYSGSRWQQHVDQRTTEIEYSWGKTPGESFKGAILGTFAGQLGTFYANNADRTMDAVKYRGPYDTTSLDLARAWADPTHPNHKLARRYLSVFNEIEPKYPLHQQKPVIKFLEDTRTRMTIDQTNKQVGEAIGLLANLEKGVTLTPEERKKLILGLKESVALTLKRDAITAEQMKKAFAEYNKEMKDAAKARAKSISDKGRKSPFWSDMTDEETEQYYKEKLQDQNRMINGFGAIARLLGDQNAAQGFDKMARLHNRITDVVLVSTKNFAKNAGAYVNVYAGLALTIAEVMSANSQKSESAMLSEQIRELAKQIEALREEMHLRFDELNANGRSQFDQVFALLGKVVDGMTSLQGSIHDLAKTLKMNHLDLVSGLRAIWVNQESKMVSKCLIYPARDQNTLRECAIYYGAMATVAAPEQPGKISQFSPAELGEVRNILLKLDPSLPIRSMTIHPATWLYAAKAYLRLFELNQKMLSVTNKDIFAHPEWSLKNMIADGTTLLTIFRSKKSSLEILNKLIDEEYTSEALEAYKDGRKSSTFPLSPNPFLGAKQIPFDTNHSFFGKPIDWCPKAPNKAITHAERIGETQVFSTFNKNFFIADKELLKLLPEDVVWASIMGKEKVLTSDDQFPNVSISACWNKIHYPSIVWVSSLTKVRIQMELDFVVHYTRKGLQQLDFTVARGMLDQVRSKGNGDILNQASFCKFPNLFWNGTTFCTSQSVNSGTWEPVAKNILENFDKNIIQSPEYTAFQEDMQKYFANQQREANRDFKAKFPADEANQESFSSKRALFFAVLLGLGSSNGSTQDFLNWINFSIPDKREIAHFGLVGVSEQTVKILLANRIAVAKEKLKALANDPNVSLGNPEYAETLAKLVQLQQRAMEKRSMN